MVFNHPPQLDPSTTPVFVEPQQYLLRDTCLKLHRLAYRPPTAFITPVISDELAVQIQFGAIIGLRHEFDRARAWRCDVALIFDNKVFIHVEQWLLVKVVVNLQLCCGSHYRASRNVRQRWGGVVPIVVVDGDGYTGV